MLLRSLLLTPFLLRSVAAVPPSVSAPTLLDLDLDVGEVGGPITWLPPGDTSSVSTYSVGLATDSSGTSLWTAGTVAVGTNTLALPADTSTGAFTHVAVSSLDSIGGQSALVTSAFTDLEVRVANPTFTDCDLDVGHLGGDVTWDPPGDETHVASYSVYLATNAVGASRSALGTSLAVGTNLFSMPADTSAGIFTHVVVYAASSLAEQTTPASATVHDTTSAVTDLLFIDQDLDALQLGGPLSWTPPADVLWVTHYDIYWAEDSSGSVRASLQSVAVGSNAITVPAETSLTSKTHVLVYSRSSLAQQTTPTAVQIVDRESLVTNLQFADMDLDAGELGGNITWTTPVDSSQVTHYRVYFALTLAGTGRSQFGADLPIATALPSVPLDTPTNSFTHIVVYTVSALAEQTTPAGILLVDSAGSVTNVQFQDLDLDGAELGGTVSWTAPSDTSQVLSYAAYLATGSGGANRQQIGGAVPLHTNAASLAADTALSSFSHVVVYAVSALGEQTTPTAVTLTDEYASATGISFTDRDLDTGELGGTVSWSELGSAQLVQSYRAYWATDSSGTARSQIGGDVPSGTNELEVSVDTALGAYTHLLIYAVSSLAEQSLPPSLAISDTQQSASLVSFVDLDLDSSEVGGTISWSAPLQTSEVTHYVVYLASSSTGASRSLVGSDPLGVAAGTLSVALPTDTQVASFSHLLVYTRSSLAEQSTPAAVSLVDNFAGVTGISFADLDADAAEIGGTLTWEPPADTSLVSQHVVYLASGTAAGATRVQLQSSVAVGTNQLVVAADTSSQGYSHIVVHERSSLAEQTAPAGAASLQDLDGSVLSLSFGDRDFDLGEIGGRISWHPPSDTSELTHYTAYLAQDSQGTARALVESSVARGTNELNMPVSTPLLAYTHLLLYSSTSLGDQTTPVAVAIADTPAVSISTQWTVTNAATTTPNSGSTGSSGSGQEWTLQELVFYSDVGCTQALEGTHLSSGQTGKYHGPAEAFDGNLDTTWRAQCAPCAAFEAELGLTVQDVVLCVRWVQSPVTSGQGASEVAFRINGQELARATSLRGGRWEGLRYAAAGHGWQAL